MTILEAVGRRRRMERAEMADALARSDAPLANGYVPASLSGHRLTRAWGWVRVCRGITLVSVGGRLRDGYVRYDEPGSMHPLQRADVSFVAASCAAQSLDYLRHHARRVVIVDDSAEDAV